MSVQFITVDRSVISGSLSLDVWSFREADCATDNYLVIAAVGERRSVRKQAAQNFDVKRFNHKELSELKVGKQYHMTFSNRFAALENLSDSDDINRA